MDISSFLDGFFGIHDDVEDEEEEEGEMPEEDAQEVEEEEPEGEAEDEGLGFTRRFSRFFKGRRREEEPEEENEPEEEEPKRRAQHTTTRDGNVIHDSRVGAKHGQPRDPVFVHTERIIKVTSIEQCGEIINYLLEGETILLNLADVNKVDSGRVVDLLSGAAFALNGRIVRIAGPSYLLAPNGVKVLEQKTNVGGSAGYYR